MAEPSQPHRTTPNPWDIGFGVVTLVAALAALFIWFPLDIKGGFIQTDLAGKPEPGDAFFPTLLAATLAILGFLQISTSLLAGGRTSSESRLSLENLKFLGQFLAIVAAGLAAMYWLGPLVADALGKAGLIDKSYRELVDTVPYKYIGYLAGGLGMTTALIAWTEGRLRPRAVAIVIAVLVVSVVIFDILLDNILLPPNADI